MRRAICAFLSLFLVGSVTPARAQDTSGDDPQTPTARPVAVEYSDAYYTRAKIHKYASFATLPLFATEVALGQNIYNDPNANRSAVKGAHIAVGTAITGLFAVNTVTGVWNMWESRHDPSHHKLKLVHGILMLGADAGFVATFATGPNGHGATLDSDKQQHRAVALTSMGIATASYLLMLFGNK
jgi:uncharacterized BrkB/YihY/UPF0761 family membrane protein